jgi:hypothetical protein
LKRSRFIFILPGTVLLIISGCISGSSDSFRKKDAETLPNFVVFFTDDQGYGDLGCFGGNHVSTPNIDRLARKGIKLTAFYIAGR